MKKKIIVGVFIISALSFGANNFHKTNNMSNPQYSKQNMNSSRNCASLLNSANLTEEQRTEVIALVNKNQEKNYSESLALKEMSLEVEKLLLAEKVDWKKVKSLNQKIALKKADMQTSNMTFRKEIEDKYGISARNHHSGMMGNGGNHKNKMKN